MERPLLLWSLLLVLTGPSLAAEGATFVSHDPYAQVSWERDIRCKTAFHTHTDVIESRIRAYDDAGYCAVAFSQYTGVPGQTSSWKVAHWPPEQWLHAGFLASLQNIQVLIPDGEHPGWEHFTAPFLTSYLECYQDSTSRFANPLCRQVGFPREGHHYSNASQLVERIHQYGGLAAIAHNIGPPTFRLLDPLPADLVEICSSNAEYSDWACDNTASCPGWNDGPARMILHYDEKLKRTPRTWAICVNDWHGPGVYDIWDPPGPEWINDSGHTLVLAPRIDLPTLKERVSTGAMLAVQDRGVPKGIYPEVVRIEVGPSSIHIEATGYTSILWIHNGVVAGAQPDIDVTALAPGTIRAELRDDLGSVVFTQPWELRIPSCSNGLDDDGDGRVDYPADPGCGGATSTLENPQCDDGLDNDGDGAIDWDGGPGHAAADTYCTQSYGNQEQATGCGLGAELLALLPALAAARRRRPARER